jgi:non-canonical (house-cleaning) NTP pyrophosphatase
LQTSRLLSFSSTLEYPKKLMKYFNEEMDFTKFIREYKKMGEILKYE